MLTVLRLLNKKKLILYLFLSILYSFQGISLSIIIQLAGRVEKNNLTSVCFFAITSFSIWMMVYLIMYFENVILRLIIKDTNLTITKAILRNTAFHFISLDATALTSTLTQDLTLFWQEYLSSLLIFPVWGVSILVSICYLLAQNLLIGLCFVIGGLSMILPQFLFSKCLKKIGQQLTQSKKESLESVSDFGKGIRTIQAHQVEQSFIDETQKPILTSEQFQFRYYQTHHLVMFWTGPLKGIGLILPFILGLLTTSLSLTTLIAMMTAATYLISPLQQLLEAHAHLQSSEPIRDKLLTLSTSFPEKNEIQATPHTIAQLKLCQISKSFAGKTIFKEADLCIHGGQHVLITGPSGCGKTTLFRLLTGEDKEFQGQIHLIDENGQCHSPSFNDIALIRQNPYIFHISLRENICLYQPVSDKQLEDVLKKVQLWDDVKDQLDKIVAAEDLSGGQVMRIEIARALLQNKNIILADEITASLDRETAEEIRLVLQQLPCTIIEIAHHFNPQHYRQIFQIDHCKIIPIK